MTRFERSNWRDEWMSHWHRNNLPDECPCHDIDCVEWRYGEPVALIEWKYTPRNTTDDENRRMFDNSHWTLARYYRLAEVLNINAYLIQYDRKGWFRLWEITQFGITSLQEMSELEMIRWHISLGKQDDEIPQGTSLSEVI